MPVSKPQPAKVAPRKKKPGTKKRTDKALKKNIEAAVAQLIAEQTETKRQAQPTVPARSYRPTTPTTPTTEKRVLLWVGVASVTCLILVLWVWNIRAMILEVTPNSSPEKGLWDTTKSDFEELLNSTKIGFPRPDDATEDIRKKVAAVLSQELSTTTPSGTASTSTVTSTAAFPVAGNTTSTPPQPNEPIQQNY